MLALLFVFVFFMYYLSEKYYKPMKVQSCIVEGVSWVPGLTWTYKQIGLMHSLSEWNSFICRGLTVCQLLCPVLNTVPDLS